MKTLQRPCCLKTAPFTSRPRTQRVARTTNVRVLAKGKKRGSIEPVGLKMQRAEMSGGPSTGFPEADPENREIVVFFRTQQTPTWIPFNLISAKTSPQLNLLCQSCETAWGRALFQKTLIKGVAASIYKEKKTLEKSIRKGNPQAYGNTPGGSFEWGMKIRDRFEGKAVNTDGITVFPSEAEVMEPAITAVQNFFNQALGGAPSTPVMPAASESDSTKQA